MALTELEIRILGSLLEKERTTPESYPLTTNSLVAACNQKTNRDPVSSYKAPDVEAALRNLQDKGLSVTVRGVHERSFKHYHKLEEAFSLSSEQFAVLAVLMLRGHQTPGELRNRTERYVQFRSIDGVEHSLEALSQHRPPLAQNHGRGPGQSQDRWGHLLGNNEEKQKPRGRLPSNLVQTDDLTALKQEITEIKAQLAYLYEHLGLDLPSPQD